MNENEVQDISGEIVGDSAEMTSEKKTELAEAAEEASQPAEQEQKTEKLFSLKFKIPLADYIDFYRIMNIETKAKNKKKTTIMGLVEIIVGVALMVMMATGRYPLSMISYFLVTAFILFGFYSFTYYKFFYEKALKKAVSRQYDKIDYLRSDIDLDFYPNKITEHADGKEVDTFWRTIHSVKVTPSLFMVMLEPKRCMLIPKSQVEGQVEAIDTLLTEVCNNFEKQRIDL